MEVLLQPLQTKWKLVLHGSMDGHIIALHSL